MVLLGAEALVQQDSRPPVSNAHRVSETHPTIDQQLCTDRKRCLIRSEEHDSIRDLTWLSEPSRGDLLDETQHDPPLTSRNEGAS